MTEPVTLRLDADTRKRLDKLAKATARSRAALAADAVRQYVELNEWQIAVREEGVRVRQANAGHLIDHARLKGKWERKLAAALDKAR
ncbi:MAG: ribbon-helix-helix domain-containing protein [Casimicrobiaceae bacterium]